MSKAPIVWDNRRPEDDSYPTAEPADFLGEKIVYVEVGTHIVNRDGDIMIVTSSNWKWHDDTSALASWNRGFIRAKYIGNQDDSLECANQIRIAVGKEVAEAKSWTKSETSYKIDYKGQLLLV